MLSQSWSSSQTVSIAKDKPSKRSRLMRAFGAVCLVGATMSIQSDSSHIQQTVFEQLRQKTCPANAPTNHPTYIAFTGGEGRVPTAIHLYEKDKDPLSYLYISGVDEDVSLSDVLVANEREALIPQIDHTIFNDHAGTTNANAIQSVMFLKDHCIQNVTLVTSDYHMPRARFVFERALRNINHQPNMSYVSINAPPLTGWNKFEEDFKYRAAQIFHGLGGQ